MACEIKLMQLFGEIFKNKYFEISVKYKVTENLKIQALQCFL